MKKIIIIVAIIVLYSCNYKQSSNISNIDSITSDNDSVATEKTPKVTVEDAYKTSAIGNIFLGISKKEYKRQIPIFYKKYSCINNLYIDEIIPFFVNNKLERLIIYSKKHLQNRNNWLSLYKSKYKNITENGIIIKNGMRIYINDNVYMKFYLNKFVFENTEEYKNCIYNEQKVKDNEFLSLDMGDYNGSEEQINQKKDLKLPKRYSMIDIRNEVLYNQVLNNYNKSYNNNFKKSYNAI